MLLAVCLVALFFCAGDSTKSGSQSCDTHVFNNNIQHCLRIFNESMETSGYQQNCPWPTTKRIYNELKKCVDRIVDFTRCRGLPADEVYLDVHRNYFSLCRRLLDPPLRTLIVLTAPAVIVTLLLPILCVKLTTKEVDTNSLHGL
ncbi:uncharacterized protein ACB058_008791 [Synchiropus picturatus]